MMTSTFEAVRGWFDISTVFSVTRPAQYNICPTQTIPVVVSDGGPRQLVDMRWGFIPSWYKTQNDGPLLINARSETIAQKPAFRDAVRTRRCLIPANGFYEWKRSDTAKEPWFLRPAHAELQAFAGIWQDWQSPDGDRVSSCSFVTIEAGPDLVDIHHREPVSIARDDFGLWLGEQGKGAAVLMKPVKAGFYEKRRISTKVNSTRNQGADILDVFEP